ncbi:MAG: thioredoxin domain-containing protein, partial [Micromonosporaceae bacterium]
DLVRRVAQVWRQRRAAVQTEGARLVAAISTGPLRAAPAGSLTAERLDQAAATLRSEHEPTYGGFGGAPKFPPHMALLFLLRQHQRTGDAASLEVVRHTAEAMARGGIHDQLAGGFARYSVDERWLVPHFEKMLYDNALLLRVYTQLWRLTGDEQSLRVATGIVGFLEHELRTPEGGLASSLDADTDGVEGATYSWTPAQLREALGDDDAAFAADLFDVTETGTFEHGTSVLRLARDLDAADPAVRARGLDVRDRLLAARGARPQPGRDDKVVAAWNGLTITALCEFAAVLAGGADNSTAGRATRLAVDAARLLADRHLVDGRLRRVSRDGEVGAPAGVLEDYGAVAEAFCAVHQLTGEGRWLDQAGVLLDVALAHFADGNGGFYDTADDAERLVTRPADPTDNATPAGRSALAAALISYTALTGRTSYRDAGQRALETIVPLLARHARFVGYAAAAAEALHAGPVEIAIATTDPAGDDLVRAAWRLAPPGAVIVAGEPDRPGVPLLADRPLLDGRPTAYVCRGFVCELPVTTVADLAARLKIVNSA